MNNLINLLKKNLILENKKSWPIGDETKKFIFDNVNEKTKSIETGIGYSTFIFAAQKSKHKVIFPDQSVEINIRNYAKEYDINLDNITFIVGKSEYVLPDLKEKINFALIDGDHKFPNPMIDFFYMNNLLEINGILIIDDLQINSVEILFQFLKLSSKWNLIGLFDNKRCCAFQKIKDDSKDWFASQEFNNKNYFHFKKNNYIKL